MAIERKSLDQICKEFNKRQGAEIFGQNLTYEVTGGLIPFSSSRLNYMVYGGLPRGKLIEFAGEEGGGKTTTALDVVANAQMVFKGEDPDNPKKILYVDAENTLDVDWARTLGVNVEELYILRPEDQYAEEIFDLLEETIRTGEIGLVVFDSLPAVASQQEYEKKIEEKTYGGISLALTNFSRKLVQVCKKTNCMFIGINQIREDLNNPYNQYKRPGGKAWGFFCSGRFIFRKGKFIDEFGIEIRKTADAPAGNHVEIKADKIKFCKPDRKNGYYTLLYHSGIWKANDLVETAIQMGVILKRGSWYNIMDEDGVLVCDGTGEPIKIQGQQKVVEEIEQDNELYSMIEGIVMSKIGG